MFSTIEIARLDFATWSGHTAMCAIGVKLGWTEEARFRDARVVRGQPYDSVVYGIHRREWLFSGE
ncbi:MAG: GNAT family N-acetyltransferase [Geodermatophilaceae bacterium]